MNARPAISKTTTANPPAAAAPGLFGLWAALIPISAALSLRSFSYDKLRELVQGGDSSNPGFIWVWNFATRPNGQCDLRFWIVELSNQQSVATLTLDDVLARILPLPRKSFHAGEVSKLFTLTPTAIKRLRDSMGGHLETSGAVFPRAGLEKFLRLRWLGAACGNLNRTKGKP